MTTTATTIPSSGSVEADLRHVTVISRKPAIAYSVVAALLALLLLLQPRAGNANFRFSAQTENIRIPDASVPGLPLAWVCVAVAVLVTAAAWYFVAQRRPSPMWLAVVFALAGFVAFLAWAGAGSDRDFPVTRLVGGAVLLAVPLVFGAMGGVIGERAGVVNIAIESQLLAGAFCAAVVGSITKSPYAGLVAAVAAGMLVALVLGLFAITYRVEQVIVGVVLNVLVVGLTSFLYSELLVPNAETLNQTVRFTPVRIPVLSEIPVLGPALFNQAIIVYIMYFAVPVVWFALYRTRWGLRLRAVG